MSSPYLIHFLLEQARKENWRVTVADLDEGMARRRVGDHPNGETLAFDVNDAAQRRELIQGADVVVSLLAPQFQLMIAEDCLACGSHMVSASYASRELKALYDVAREKGLLLLAECGLDPGIDHMSSMEMIESIRADKGKVISFWSYGSGVPAPESISNPLKYAITWNPRNVVMAGEKGAQYLEHGHVKIVPRQRIFEQTWHVDVEGLGEMEAYSNRDSLSYPEVLGLKDVRTMVRATLRYPGFAGTWRQIVSLGLSDETIHIPDLQQRSYAEVVEMFLPLNLPGRNLPTRLSRLLNISPTGHIMQNLKWLGLFSEDKVSCKGDTAAAMLIDLLQKKLVLHEDECDMVVLQHEMEVEYEDKRRELRVSTMVHKGEAGGFTAMSRTVGLPAALAVCMILKEEILERGVLIPIHPGIYKPILEALASEGITFEHSVRKASAAPELY